jgi:hypothetical protein
MTRQAKQSMCPGWRMVDRFASVKPRPIPSGELAMTSKFLSFNRAFLDKARLPLQCFQRPLFP